MEPTPLDDVLCHARCFGRRAGLSAEDVEDCAAQFAERLLVIPPPVPLAEAWLHRCARNFALDYVRAQRRRDARVCRWPQAEGDAAEVFEFADTAPPVDVGLMQDEFRRHVAAALAKLDPVPQQIFLRHHLNGEPVQDLAAVFNRTPHAVEQTLLRSRKRLRQVLERQGLTEAELRQYLPLPCAALVASQP